VISEAVVSGPAPGSCVETWTVGKSISGNEEIGSKRNPSAPATRIATLINEVATGRAMKGADTLMAAVDATDSAPLLMDA